MVKHRAGSITGVIVVVALLIGCSGSRSRPEEGAGASGNNGIDYEALQQKALAFTPAIGNVGGEIVLSTFSDPKSFNPITSTEMTTSPKS